MATEGSEAYTSPISVACALLLIAGLAPTVVAQPRPGDVYREYRWTNEGGDAGGSLRVGGRFDYGGGPIELPHDFDLDAAVRAEVVVEKVLCHDGTRGLAISVNDGPWLSFPEPAGIPEPQWAYQHHAFPVVEVSIEQLNAGHGNQFRLKVADEHPWNWPQNLIYGVHFRVYYDGDRKPHPTGRVVSPAKDDQLGVEVSLRAEASSPNGAIRRVDFVGRYEDVNLEGDGQYTRWHYRYAQAQLVGHLGTADSAPWSVKWNTSWVPDQMEPFQLAAIISDETGLSCFTSPVAGLTFERGNLKVELCKPYGVPKKWVTRSGEHEEKFRIEGDLSKAVAAQLVWSSWSPGYMEGVFINGTKVLQREGPRYACSIHRVPLDELSCLTAGENTLRTGKTPKHNGKMVHGMEVNWPGIMVLIRYEE